MSWASGSPWPREEARDQREPRDAAPATLGQPCPGYGLIGMRERVLSVGGRLRAGRQPAGGFAVAVELPMYSRGPDEGLIP